MKTTRDWRFTVLNEFFNLNWRLEVAVSLLKAEVISWLPWQRWDGRGNSWLRARLRVKCGSDLVIFGHGRRGAVTACGLRTEDPVFVVDGGAEAVGWGVMRRGEHCGGGEEELTMDGLLPCRQFLTYSLLKWMSVTLCVWFLTHFNVLFLIPEAEIN